MKNQALINELNALNSSYKTRVITDNEEFIEAHVKRTLKRIREAAAEGKQEVREWISNWDEGTRQQFRDTLCYEIRDRLMRLGLSIRQETGVRDFARSSSFYVSWGGK